MTRRTRKLFAFAVSAGGAAAAAGCIAASGSGASVTVALDAVPEGLSCLRVSTVSTEGSGEDWRLYDVAARAKTVAYELSGLPDGSATVKVEGFDRACRSVAPATTPLWSAPSTRLAGSDDGPRKLHFVLESTFWGTAAARSTTEIPGGVVVTFSSSLSASGATDTDAGAAGDPAAGGAEGGPPGDSATGSVEGGATSPEGGPNPEGGTSEGGMPAPPQTTCWGPVCVTLSGGPTADGGAPPADGGAPARPGLCIGRLCLVSRLPDGGVPPGATCLGPICTVSTGVPGADGGAEGGSPLPTQVCVGALCAELVPREGADGSAFVGGGGDAGPAPSPFDGGTPSPTCSGSVCVYTGPGGGDSGVLGGGSPPPIAICDAQNCVVLQPPPPQDGGATGGPGATGTLASVCFGQSCVSVSLRTPGGAGDAGTD